MRSFLRVPLVVAAGWAVSTFLPATASACGGFFCNAAQPVNQAAEGIIFADNGDGTTTAVIQIQYQGPSQSFSWLLPISSVPKTDADIGIASNVALQRLQSATNPSYSLTVRQEGTCRQRDSDGGCGGSTRSFAAGASAPRASIDDSSPDPQVVVEASGVVGAFQWTVISLDPTLADPAAAAAEWLKANSYDVPSSAPALLGPYLKQGLFLLALRLTKGADTGSIRPIVLTYKGQPSIPVKLTAVAANDDMGVLTWVLGSARAVPANYLSLDLNEARLDWLTSASNYNSVVTEAADDAGGQGFVTELAGSTSTLADRIWTPADASNWFQLSTSGLSGAALFQMAQRLFGQWDGFWDATFVAVSLPNGSPIEALKACPTCYAVQLQPADFIAQLDRLVVQPVKRVQALIDAHSQITRLYTTLSADEMTVDPLFGFNRDLPDLSNVHSAERVIVCNPSVYASEAPWHVELPQGDTVWGKGTEPWPAALSSLPPNRLITRTAETGQGKVIEDNTDAIATELAHYNSGKSGGVDAGGGCAAGRGRSRGAWLAAAAFLAAMIRRRRRSAASGK